MDDCKLETHPVFKIEEPNETCVFIMLVFFVTQLKSGIFGQLQNATILQGYGVI